VSPDLGLDDSQQAVADVVTQFCDDHCREEVVKALAGQFPRELWSGLARLGVLALATPEGDGGAVEVVAACESLGRAAFPGPLLHSFLATQVLDSDDRVAVAEGRCVVSVGTPPLLPWAPVADRFVEIDGFRAFRASRVGEILPVETLGGEPWGRVVLEREADLGDATSGLALYAIALAAYLTAAGRELVARTGEHARTRKQFGHPIGEFQAVAHPLADCEMHLAAAETLARQAAFRFDQVRGEVDAQVASDAGCARLSAAAASVESAHVCHQLFGALGITLEGPVFHLSRKIRQLASQAPRADAARNAVLAEFGL
jgi:alkylation response protein AidB-like acyl-CoA dehydrogenase